MRIRTQAQIWRLLLPNLSFSCVRLVQEPQSFAQLRPEFRAKLRPIHLSKCWAYPMKSFAGSLCGCLLLGACPPAWQAPQPSVSPSPIASLAPVSSESLQQGLLAHYGFDSNVNSDDHLHDGYTVREKDCFSEGVRGKSISFYASSGDDTGVFFKEKNGIRLPNNFSISIWNTIYPGKRPEGYQEDWCENVR